MKRSIKIGIFGLGRGSYFYKNILLNNGDVVAVCDMNEQKLADAREQLGGKVATYTSFDEFIKHDGMEAVMLCNYFHEHAAYAIRALERNIHVLSECTSNATMAEGVALMRAAEKSAAYYMISENYPFMLFNREITRVCRGGTLGKLLFAEGEYNHPVSPDDHKLIRELHPFPKHWRNYLPRSYYITHSLAPLMYATGAFPKRVSAFGVHTPEDWELLKWGSKTGDRAAIVTTLNDDGSVFRVTGCAAFGAHENSYRVCGTYGQIENVRGGEDRVMLRYNKWNTPEDAERNAYYLPAKNDPEEALIEQAGHGGGDFLVIREFFTSIREGKPPIMDAHFATTMASVAILSHRSILNGNTPYDIPDLRREEDRLLFENDTDSPFWGNDGSAPSIPCSSDPLFRPSDDQYADYRKVLEEI